MKQNMTLFYEVYMYGKTATFAVLIVLISGSSETKTEQPELSFNSAQEHIRYIIEDYSFGSGSNYILDYIDNKYATNEFIIDSIADKFTNMKSIKKISDNVYRVETDKETLDITLIIENGKIKKIKAREAKENE